MSSRSFRAILRRFTLVSALAISLAPAGCSPGGSTVTPGSGSGGAGVSGSAGTTAGAAGASGAAGTSGGAAGTSAAAAGASGGAAGASGGAAGTSGGAAGTSGGAAGTSAGAAGASAGAPGAAGSTAGASGGVGSVAGGPPAFSKKPLSVIAYSPYRDGQAPGGAQPSMADVKADLMMLQPLVDGVRVYGTDGAQAYIPALCDQLGIDLHMGAWIDGLPTDEPNVHALAAIVNANHPSLKTAIIGNEVLARAGKQLNNVTEARMLELINIFKTDNKNKTVKIATADTYVAWMVGRPNLAAAVDLLIWHTYAWWSGIDISGSAAVVSSRYDDMLALYPGKPMVLGETGWPSMVTHPSTDLTTMSVGNEVNQARFYRETLAIMRARNLPMWMFDAIDEKWKGTSGEGAVGSAWGIFTSARQPKMAATELMTSR